MINPESWERVKTIFHHALEHSAEERREFVERVCLDESSEIEKEVLELLAAHKASKGILDAPMIDVAAQLELTLPDHDSLVGQLLGVYQIVSHLGGGGMGEVYLARDTRLGRAVALKILSPEFMFVPDLVRRFQQEARAASALNHPNILTIHDIGQINGVDYIATEYVEGLTLRQLNASQGLTLDNILDVALQVTAALAAAHKAGIVHRDIKPQNIMVRPDGLVKVVDFGIAKLVEKQLGNSNPQIFTATGAILGTATYMSPEQARGFTVDARSDIWSLGVTLYEMLAGQIPFKGQTTSDVIVSILEREPVPIIELVPSLPDKLNKIINRCLNKNIDLRYQTIEDLSRELQSLSPQRALNGDLLLTPLQLVSKSEMGLPAADHRTTLKATQNQSPGVKTDKNRFNYFKQAKKWQFVTAIFLLTILGGIFASSFQIGLFKNGNGLWSNGSAKPFQTAQITRLTTTGNVLFVNVSPDGRFIAYVTQDADKQSLWIKQIVSASSKLILPATADFYRGLTFSSDSNFIYYVIHEKARGIGVLYAVSTLGGESRKIMEDVDSPITFAPDGKSYGFMRGFDDNGVRSMALLIAHLESQTTRKLAVHRDPNLFAGNGFAWSPDGKTIVTATINTSDSNQWQMSLVAIETSDGSERPFTLMKWQDIGRVAWLGNNKGIVMTALGADSGLPQITQISYPEGEIQSVTKNLTGYSSASATNDGRGIVAIESVRISHIWTAPADNLAQTKRITSNAGRYFQPSWTPDHKIIYISEESGNKDVWIMDADGNNAKQLIFDKADDYKPLVTPDGRYIVFSSKRGGIDQVWRMNSDTSNPLRLTDGDKAQAQDISLDGKLVYYATYNAGKIYFWSVSIDGGNPTRMFDFPASNGRLSPDGKWIVCWFLDEQTNATWQIGTASMKGGRIIKTLNIPIDNSDQIVSWAPNSQALSYTTALDDLHNLWNYPLNDKLPKQITNFDSSNQILYFNWSRDGKNIVFLRGSKPKDVVYLNADNN